MKTLKNLSILTFTICLLVNFSFAQQKFRVHEDIIKPSHVMEYEGILAEMMALVNKHKVKDASWITLTSINSHYMYIAPISNYADLDKPSFITQLVEKEGAEKIKDLFDRMDKCYDTELDYTITLDSELSYMPNGITQTPEGENYRQNHVLYVTPSKRAVVKEKLQALKALYTSKKSKLYYRVYKSGFGTDGEYYMVAVAAKDAEDYAKKSNENETLIGEELQSAINEMYFNSLRYEKIEGMIRPDLGYSSK
tara:strand:- start:4659 stop:5414 length:756 start_codon:yes stop_codon:yes gene_type:complete